MVHPNRYVVLVIVICVLAVFPPREWLSGFQKLPKAEMPAMTVEEGISESSLRGNELVRSRAATINDGVNVEVPPDTAAQVSNDPTSSSFEIKSSSGLMEHEITPLVQIRDHGRSYTPKVHDYGWVFKRYVSSRLEDEFYDAVGPVEKDRDWVPAMVQRFRPQFEKLLRDMKQRSTPNKALLDHRTYYRECEAYIKNTVQGVNLSVFADGSSCLSSSLPMDPEIFSRFEYEFQCIDEPCNVAPPAHHPKVGDTHVSYIEPLGGLMRHPLVFMMNNAHPHAVNRAYMIPDKWALNNLHLRYRQKKKHSHYFDCGASTYVDGAGGASQNWFIGLGDCMCTPFDTMRLWEMQPHRPWKFWGNVPERLHPNYMWYNYPLSADVSSFANPVNHLISKVRFGDPVIMKVDFDAPALEIKIIDAILATPDAYRRIDEFFFEHHVNIPILAPIWGWRTMNTTCFIRCTIDLFKSLRKVGIRAHSWV